MNTQIKTFQGMKAGQAFSKTSCQSLQAQTTVGRISRTALRVEANKKVKKTKQVVLLEDLPNLGRKGDLTVVSLGYYNNFLAPTHQAMPATDKILSDLRAKDEAETKKKREVKAKAEAMATALKTIGKFVIKKKAGEEDQIFGGVSPAEVVEAIYMQTSRKLSKGDIDLPEIKTLGTYECNVKLHPEVIGSFQVIVQKEKEAPPKSK